MLVFSKRQAYIKSEVGLLNAAMCLWERYIAPQWGRGPGRSPDRNRVFEILSYWYL